MKAWVSALSTTLGMQTVSSFMNQSLPIVAPLLTAGTGLAPERIGNIQSMNALGAVLFLIFGGPLLARLGPVRSLQAGAVLACLGLLVAASGWWPALLLSGFVMGIGYGPSPPAGSRILAATAPPRHRTLIFSIKQAGAPAGGAAAGFVLAPVAAHWGWPAALLIAVAVGLVACLVIASQRERLDVERDPAQKIGFRTVFRRENVRQPFAAATATPELITLAALGVAFSLVQGCLFGFTVTYLSVDRGLSLPAAGTVYAAMQGAGVVARIGLGWLADRTGTAALNLTIQAMVASVTVLLLAWVPAGAPLWLFAAACALTGFVAASWNGIYMAEVVRLSPPRSMVAATAGSSVFTFLGYTFGPSMFALLVTLGGWFTAFVVIAAQLGLMALVQGYLLLRPTRRLVR